MATCVRPNCETCRELKRAAAIFKADARLRGGSFGARPTDRLAAGSTERILRDVLTAVSSPRFAAKDSSGRSEGTAGIPSPLTDAQLQALSRRAAGQWVKIADPIDVAAARREHGARA